MQKLSALRIQAIQAAKCLDWEKAIEINQEILEQNENDLEALNRLGLAYLQSKQVKKAKKTFLKVLKLDKTNKIAKKHLKKIKNKQINNITQFSTNEFIENPGKSKNIPLHRLANKQILESLSIGQTCRLVPKSRYISVETEDKTYIGALPEDLSFRLTKLIQSGNHYLCSISCFSAKQCIIHIQEVETSKENSHISSFPVKKVNYSKEDKIRSDFVIGNDIPVQSSLEDEEGEHNQKVEETLKKINSA
ncbi:MAG: tetratricopeptide repeat protein [Candidatus Woesebacteria bacterium]|jgi:tetratricopeptide (TPR) repeat protein